MTDKPTQCPYCGGQVVFTDSAEIYGKSFGMIYLCRPCNAYVGVRKGTDRALGRLADSELRHWKKAAHAAFDPLWQMSDNKQVARGNAYKWLAEQMQLPSSDAHIGMMDVEQCKRVVELCNTKQF